MAYRDEVLADTPLLYWRLDETTPGTGSAADASGNGRNGTYVASPVSYRSLLYGDSNPAVDFNGSSQWVTSTYNPFATASNRTFEFWAVRDDSVAQHAFFGGDVGSVQPLFVQAISVNTIQFFTDAGSSGQTWTGPFPPGQIMHIVLTWTGGTKTSELWVNGVSQGTKPHATDFNAAPGNLSVGKRSTASNPFNGKIDEFAIYGSVLSQARILEHYRTALLMPQGPVRPLMPLLSRMTLLRSPVWTPSPPLTAEVAAEAPPGDTPTPGGATAGGFEPVAVVPVPVGGAAGQAVSPSVRVPVPQGGGIGQGTGPIANAAVSLSGAVAGGLGPVARSSVTLAGAVGSGLGPSPAVVTFSPGGATAGGYAPSAPLIEAVPQGGAVASGVGPTARVPVPQGGAIGQGVAPVTRASVTQGGAAAAGFAAIARVPVPQGGAAAGGRAPGESTSSGDTVPAGGAAAAGVAPSVRVSTPVGGAAGGGLAATARVAVTIGGAAASGYSPGESIAGGAVVPSGGAAASGFSPSVRVTTPVGGSIGQGVTVPVIRVAVPQGGAVAGGRPPLEPVFEGYPGPFDTGTDMGRSGELVTAGVSGGSSNGRSGARNSGGGFTSSQSGRIGSE